MRLRSRNRSLTRNLVAIPPDVWLRSLPEKKLEEYTRIRISKSSRDEVSGNVIYDEGALERQCERCGGNASLITYYSPS